MPMLKAYLDRTGRPWLPVAYEDFEGGDKSKVERACLTLGLTAREDMVAPIRPVLERTWDEVNADWVARFRPDAKTGAIIEDYKRLIASIAPGG